MSDFTIRNLEACEDQAQAFGVGHLGSARFPAKEVDAQQTGFSHQVLKPGMRQAFGHVHDSAEEVYVVIGGSGRVKLDDDLQELRRLDVLRVGPKVKRRLEAGDEGLEILVFGPRHEGDGEMLPDFWAPEDGAG